MRHGGKDHIKWVALTTITIVVLVVDATVNLERGESVACEKTAKQDFRENFSRKVFYVGDQVWRIYKHNDSVNDLVEQHDQNAYQIWSNHPLTVDIFVRSQMLYNVDLLLNNCRIKYDVLIKDVQKAIDDGNVRLTTAMQTELEGRKGHRMEWTSYHDINDIYGYLDYLANTYPDVCSVQSIGNSIEGQPLKVLRISNGKTENTPAIWIDGGIHAREWISPAAVTYVIDNLVENSDVLQTDYYILPVANPDGYRYTFLYDRLWRKNRRKGTVCSGVDLNRNFGYRWGGKGTSSNMCYETYRGSKAFSEPETNAIRNFFENSLANFKAYISFHSYGQYILYPWGYDQRLPPDYRDLDAAGLEAARYMKYEGGDNTEYTVGNSAITLYPAAGGSDDWAKALLKIKYAYTIELRDTGRHGFLLPPQYIIPTAKEALAAVKVITGTIRK
ncbi:PREDICTED: carboxypeptidase B-like [Trachymyrmex cornetzi]|uniref:Carboxypeptidase B n=1 Tax=Trachymyrmex cornetzi TaxID=471704 RepID=A0A195D8N6_9HYME|nr:PREDICTED: carboxypeptidase B-like [Trachymyrmex cornetzi]KYN09226.1 Carboxypeptidase B [Trachymyrmex cornetzi]